MRALPRFAALLFALAAFGAPYSAQAGEYNLSIGKKIVEYNTDDADRIDEELLRPAFAQPPPPKK